MIDQLKKNMFIGIGLMSMTKERVREFGRKLAEDSKLSEAEGEKLVENAAERGAAFMDKLRKIRSRHIKQVRGRGLLIGVELYPAAGGARRFCEELMKEGLLCKETHENVIRFAPPLIIRDKDLNWALKRIKAVFKRLA